MTVQAAAPVTLLGSNISYFTWKMENYLRLKRIPYRRKSIQFLAARKRLERELAVMQMPAVILPDGSFQYAMGFVGMTQRCLELMCARAQERVAFGGPLIKNLYPA